MAHPDKWVREQGHKRLAVVAKTASDLGIPLITLCTGSRDAADQWRHHPDNASKDAWRDMMESMAVAIEIADHFNVDLGIEPELANVVSNAKLAKRLIDECKSPRLKIILDAANLFEVASLAEQRNTVSEAIELLAPRIAMAHAKDRAPDGAFVAAGKGVLDYPHFLKRIEKCWLQRPACDPWIKRNRSASGCSFFKKKSFPSLEGGARGGCQPNMTPSHQAHTRPRPRPQGRGEERRCP